MIKPYHEDHQLELLPLLNSILKKYFIEIRNHALERSRKIAWCSSAGPVELLRAMGFDVYFPEAHWELLGPLEAASDFEPGNSSETAGPKFHSFLTADPVPRGLISSRGAIPKFVTGDGIPEPDLLVFNTIQGRGVKNWLGWYASKLGKPIIGIYSPRNLGDINTDDIKSYVRQLRNVILTLETISGRKFEIDRLKECVWLSRKCAELWQSCLNMSTYLPAPWSFFDHLVFMIPAVVMRGKQAALDFYELLFSEIFNRVRRGDATVTNEQIRLFWYGSPTWAADDDVSTTLTSLNASIVASTYCNGWDLTKLDEDLPLASMAAAYSSLYPARSTEYNVSFINRFKKDYRIDGILFNNSEANSHIFPNCEQVLNNAAHSLHLPVLEIHRHPLSAGKMQEKINLADIEQFLEQMVV